MEYVARRIFLVRGQRVMLDTDLARLYEVETFYLNKAVKRNFDRFPADFMFQLSKEEAESLTFQFGMSKIQGRGGRRTRPYVFTEHGVAMLSSVLRSERAVQMNILIIRAFIALRDTLATNKDLARKMRALELRQAEHGEQLAAVYSIVKRLVNVPEKPKKPNKRIGFAQVGGR